MFFYIKPQIIGRVLELLINSKKTSTSPIFKENVERFLCLRFFNNSHPRPNHNNTGLSKFSNNHTGI